MTLCRKNKLGSTSKVHDEFASKRGGGGSDAEGLKRSISSQNLQLNLCSGDLEREEGARICNV